MKFRGSISRLGLTIMCLSLFLPALSLAQVSKMETDDSIHVFLLRGLGRESAHWGHRFRQTLRQQMPQARIHLLDLPGAGQWYDQPVPMSIEQMAHFMHAHHPDTLKGPKILLATSLAGMVAVEWTAQYPDDFDQLVLVSASLRGICTSDERVKVPAKAKFVDIFLTFNLIKREQKFIDINSNYHTDSDSLLKAWINIQEKHPVGRFKMMQQTLAAMRYRSTVAPTLPTLVVGSYGDQIVASTCACKVRAYVGGELRMHPFAGHGIPLDEPAWLAEELVYWLNTQQGLQNDAWAEMNLVE